MDWFSMFAHNLADSLFWLGIISLFLAGGISFHSLKTIRKVDFASPDYRDAKWRMWTASQGATIIWLLWVLLGSIPEPNYQIKYIDRIKEVSVLLKYNEAFDVCADELRQLNRRSLDVIKPIEIADRCEERARIVTYPNLKTVVTTQWKADPYVKLFAACMGDFTGGKQDAPWSVDGDAATDKRNERIQLCHKQTLEAREEIRKQGGDVSD